MSYQPKIYKKSGGDEMVIASGATMTIEDGATIVGSGITVAGVTATAAEINKLAGLATTKIELAKLASSGAVVASGTAGVHLSDLKSNYVKTDIDDAGSINGTEISVVINSQAVRVNEILAMLEAFKINAAA